MASADHLPQSEHHDVTDHHSTYQRMMDVGFGWGLPVGLGIAMFVFLWLLGVSLLLPPTAPIIGFLTFLGVRGISKTFFMH